MTRVPLTKHMANQLNKLYWVEHDKFHAASADAIKEWIGKEFNAIMVEQPENPNRCEYFDFEDERDATLFLIKVA
jgi:hypothetical protein